MHLAKGILTATGGKASHAAVVARGWGKPCVVGCDAIQIDEKSGTFTIGGHTVKAGDFVTIDGTTGDVMIGKVPTVDPTDLGRLRDVHVMGRQGPNPQDPHQRRHARRLSPRPVVRCRGDRTVPHRAHVFRRPADRRHAQDDPGRRRGGAKGRPRRARAIPEAGLHRYLRGDGRLPVTIRLLDPPLHEFLPQDDNPSGQAEVARQLGISVEKVKRRVEQLHEANPMLGLRGCRLPIKFPEIGDMQVRAIIQAAIEVKKRGKTVLPEIMIPLVGVVEELTILKKRAIAIAEAEFKKAGVKVEYQIGTMIEVPRAALTADQIAEEAEFFSFGTNDLTQLTFGFSRDDIGSFMPAYVEQKILPVDPFQTIDVKGVGQLIEIGVSKGRKARQDKHGEHLKVGICGEHGGDPDSVAFCHKVGMDYVSCSPFRVPIARLAAAQAALAGGKSISRDK